MVSPSAVARGAGAALLILSGGGAVTAFYPGFDPAWVLGSGFSPGLGRLAVAGVAAVGLLPGFWLVGIAPRVVRARGQTELVLELTEEDKREPASQAVAERAVARPLTPEEEALRALDADLRALKQQIQRARVAYGMGRLSAEGYTTYVRDLELRQAAVERERIQQQIHVAAMARDPSSRPIRR